MKIIEKMSKMVGEELHDAKKYILCAMESKAEHPEVAELFASLSDEEMQHMDRLHKSVVKIITNSRQQNGEPPAAMLAVYNCLHEQWIKKADKVKAMQRKYKEM